MPCAAAYFIPFLGEANFSSVVRGEIIFETIALYMDTNFCNLLNIWDRIFGTLEHEKLALPPEYGITRPMNPHNFIDVYFGEIVVLAKDVIKAPGIKNKLFYIIMSPGWSHTGQHKTAKVVREEFLKSQQSSSLVNNIAD